jgi:hypothetical protein
MLYIVVTNFGKLLEFLSSLGHFYKKEFLILFTVYNLMSVWDQR